MPEPLSQVEPQESPNEPLNITHYEHWRGYLYKLQIGETVLPNVPKEESSDIGQYGHNIALNTIRGLREDRHDEHGKPYILLSDEVSNTDVLTKATKEERMDFFVKGLVRTIEDFWIEATDDRLKNFVVASVALGSALTGESPDEVKKLIMDEIPETEAGRKLAKNLFLDQIRKCDTKRLNETLDYLKFSQGQMTLEEEYALRRKFKPVAPLGSEPLNIEGKDFEFVGSSKLAWLTDKDTEYLEPLKDSMHISRSEIVNQGQKLARKLFNLDDRDIFRIPEWWSDASGGDELKSTDRFIFIPYDLTKSKGDLPEFIKDIHDMYDGGGWFHIEISSQYDRPLIVGASRLHS